MIHPHLFGLQLCLSPEQAVNAEAGMPRGKQALCSLRAEKLPANE